MSHSATWSPPPNGCLKFNLDAALFVDQNRVGCGICVRDNIGHFVMALTDWTKATMTAAEGEAWSLLQALRWASFSNLNFVIFEVDCKKVVDDIHTANKYGSILDECRIILSLYNNYKVVFTTRHANGSAHALAKASTTYAPRTTFYSVHFCI